MSRDHKSEVTTEKRIEYAYWTVPNAGMSITYSLPLFHEVDFAVNEGYRKIPHGGIEEGGLLFGKIDQSGTRIEAFRPIYCEHASGPSLLFSERDLEALTAQLANAASDPELAALEPVGWFLAHTRGPLLLTEREAELFERYFKKPGTLTVLVKPERFQPTRFGFLVRGKDGVVPRDATQNAIILPLPGRNARAANGPIVSIPAPALAAAVARRVVETENQVRAAERARSAPGTEPPAVSTPAVPAADEIPAEPGVERPAEDRAHRRQRRLTLDQVVPESDEEQQEKSIPAKPAGVVAAPSPAEQESTASGELEPTERGAPGRDLYENALALRAGLQEGGNGSLLPDPYRQIELLSKKKPASTAARFVMVLPLAALLGCLVGYVAYLQVPSPIISLSIKGKGETVVVTWPADQTRSAVYAAVRVDDSTPVMLTPEERSAGRVEVTASADMKVELIARNWIHDSRGIVRFVKPLAKTAP
jgi:hypothetical protein